MSAPHRVQLSRRKGWRLPADTVVVARPSRWGNPWIAGEPGIVVLRGRDGPIRVRLPMAITPAGCVDRYRRWLCGEFAGPTGAIRMDHPLYEAVICDEVHIDPTDLRGKSLACWCPLDAPCHADVLLELANREGAA